MSTRGTYQVRIMLCNEEGCPDDFRTLCFYNHSDNYPSGAALFFKEALAMEWKYQIHGKTMAKRLICLDGFEFTECHEAHGDTEYRYNIFESKEGIWVEALKRCGWGLDTKWCTIFDGPIQEFIKGYHGEGCKGVE